MSWLPSPLDVERGRRAASNLCAAAASLVRFWERDHLARVHLVVASSFLIHARGYLGAVGFETRSRPLYVPPPHDFLRTPQPRKR